MSTSVAKKISGTVGLGPVITERIGARRVPEVPAGWVVFVTTSPSLTVACKLGEGTARREGGVGGWTTVDRPGRKAGLEWAGTPAETLTVPILLDGLVGRRSVESQINALNEMGRPITGSPRGTPPPVVRVGGMIPHGDRQWVIAEIEWGDAMWDGRRRIRQWATLTFAEYAPLDLVKVTPRKASSPSTKSYTVKRGDTLGSIARDRLNARSSGAVARGIAQLKKLNGLRSSKDLKVGRKLKIPTTAKKS